MRPNIDNEITYKRPIIQTRRHSAIRKLWKRLVASCLDWYDMLLFAAWNLIPPSRRFANDKPIEVDRTPHDCDHCPYRGFMVEFDGGSRCPKCFAIYVEAPSPIASVRVVPVLREVEDVPTQVVRVVTGPIVSQPHTIQSGEISLHGNRLFWNDTGEPVVKMRQPQFRKQLLLPAGKEQHDGKA